MVVKLKNLKLLVKAELKGVGKPATLELADKKVIA
jgi:hypothetical protein